MDRLIAQENLMDTANSLTHRPRRNRKSPAIRSLLQETHLLPSDLVAPLFITEGSQQKQAITSMPGIFRFSIDALIQEINTLASLGINAVNLFVAIPENQKDSFGSEALREGNLLHDAIRAIKQHNDKLCVMVDIALDPYTDHGHDGILNGDGYVDNDATVAILTEISVLAAHAGADVVAPSDMMDGRVAAIRNGLDQAGFENVNILSYTAKYASAFYGPFRDALHSTPRFGDKKSYQMNPANVREAILECTLDEAEGADMLLVKPALAYLDIISAMRQHTSLPIGAYHVSGEYAMVMAAAEKGWLDADAIFLESLLSIKRAGADFILTYAAERVARQLIRR